jgi:hypothetical protein
VPGFNPHHGFIRAGGSQMTEKTEPDRIGGMQVLSEMLDAQRKRTEDAWHAVTAEMRNDAWRAGRDKDRRISTNKHEPERRRPVISP